MPSAMARDHFLKPGTCAGTMQREARGAKLFCKCGDARCC